MKRGSADDARTASIMMANPVGSRNQPDLPKSVNSLKVKISQNGKRFAVSAAQASTKTMTPASTTTAISTPPAIFP